MDNFAVTISSGCSAKSRLSYQKIFLVSSCFALAHIVMFSAGWWGGHELGRLIDWWDHWLAAAILVGVGGHMLHENSADQPAPRLGGDFSLRLLLMLAVATSLDALGVGIALSLENSGFWLTLGFMTGCVFITSWVGFLLGRILGNRFGKVMEAAGAVVLILLGIKILLSGLGIW